VQNDKVLSERVRRERLSLDYSWLKRYRFCKTQSAIFHQEFLGPDDPQKALEDFISTAHHFGVKKNSERFTFEDQMQKLRDQLAPTPSVPLPDFARSFPADAIIDIQQNQFRLPSLGKTSEIVDDASASDGKSASAAGNSNSWDVQAHLDQFMDSRATNWHIYALARVDAAAGADPNSIALRGGIYDLAHRDSVSRSTFPLQQVAGKQYQVVDMGTHSLAGGMYIWLAAAQNKAVSRIYVDRIILVRQ
jgi:hypothetical protein